MDSLGCSLVKVMQFSPTVFGLVSYKVPAIKLFDCILIFFHILCPRRKQLSEYLPPRVLKQKKKSSIVPPVSYKPYLEVQLYACLGINRFTGGIV